MKDKSCLEIDHEHVDRIPDYCPTSLKQAKSQMRAECKGKTSTTQLLGLLFRFNHSYVTQDEVDQFDAYCMNICNKTLKRWNKARKK